MNITKYQLKSLVESFLSEEDSLIKKSAKVGADVISTAPKVQTPRGSYGEPVNPGQVTSSSALKAGPGTRYDTPEHKKLKSDPKFAALNDVAKLSVAALVLMKKELSEELRMSGKNEYLMFAKVAMAIQGRETKFGGAAGFITDIPETTQSMFVNTTKDFFKDNFGVDDVFRTTTKALDYVVPDFIPYFGDKVKEKSAQRLDTSIGPSQIVYSRNFKKGVPLHDFGRSIGIENPEGLISAWKSIFATVGILKNLYAQAESLGYDKNKAGINDSINNLQSTGNAQLDITIMSFNLGAGRAFQKGLGYCGVADSATKKPCKSKTQNDRVKNYLPNYVTGKITSIGYLEEAAGYIKDFAWLSKHI